ncbi:hypothetical protein PSTT_05020 [Puccinia striiformis]|uniref:Heat shock 70kDa protein 4 n=1 Tax=Puccinia striiformis TaxID=27350 RepID=A0A2S4VQJ9_9BASI|nr:hypothetical protein PSTT_05020 [Puccinia striiformis]
MGYYILSIKNHRKPYINMTSVVGLDVGNMASKIGLARKRGIDIIANEVSNRATPSLVAFGPRNRSIGESAKTQETSNFRNTVGSLKRLIGRSANDPDVTEIESKFLNAELVDANGTVGVKVNYLGEDQVLSATQLYAALLGRLRDTAQAELKANVNDVVIAVPAESRLRCCRNRQPPPLRLINELTATALGYGITKTDLPAPEEKPRYVAFVDIGHSQYQVAIVAFSKGALHVKGFAYDHHFGGRDLDYALLKHFASEFKEKYKIDVLSNKKAIFRLAAAVEKLKKVLSANAQAPLNVESLMNDIDATSSFTREAFEELIAPLLERTIAPLERALAQADISKDDIETVELIGGSTRVPALKSRVQEFFGKPLSFTCNQDEAVARGATLACAGLSPIFKVREFAVTDIVNFSINTVWQPISGDPNTTLETFIPESHVPSGKQLTFYRSEPFELELRYPDASKLPGSINPFIARYVVRNVGPDAKGQPSSVKIKAKLNISGLVSLEGAVAYEEVQPTKKTVKKELSASFMASSLDRPALDDLLAKEGDMHAGDKLVSETEDRRTHWRNMSVNDTRDKLEGAYAPFVTREVKQQLLDALSKAEEWLYSEEGEDASKSQYVARLDELNAIGNPIKFRQREAEDRPRAERQLRETISDYMQKAHGGDPMYAHISEKDIQTAIEKCAAAEKWIGDCSAKQAELSKTQEPAMSSTEILKRKDNLMFDCNSIFNKPPPKPTANPDANKNGNQNGQNENAQPANEQAQAEPTGEETEGEKPAPGTMDVD